jgi:hypothetical protein
MIKINGKVYSGNVVSIINGKVTIDGVPQTGEALSGVVRVEVTGDLKSLRTDANAVVTGNVLGDVDAGGSVNCGDVEGDIDAGGSVRHS